MRQRADFGGQYDAHPNPAVTACAGDVLRTIHSDGEHRREGVKWSIRRPHQPPHTFRSFITLMDVREGSIIFLILFALPGHCQKERDASALSSQFAVQEDCPSIAPEEYAKRQRRNSHVSSSVPDSEFLP